MADLSPRPDGPVAEGEEGSVGAVQATWLATWSRWLSSRRSPSSEGGGRTMTILIGPTRERNCL
jgi:hypothetical protein